MSLHSNFRGFDILSLKMRKLEKKNSDRIVGAKENTQKKEERKQL